MKKINKIGAQGDVAFRRVCRMPEGAVLSPASQSKEHVIAHSETGHHHTVSGDSADLYIMPNDPFTSYLVLKKDTDVVHHRPFDQHETLRLLNDGVGEVIFEIKRQREYSPWGDRMVQD